MTGTSWGQSAEFLEHVQSVHVGQAQVQKHQIGTVGKE